jgi:biopolymer transport protein ExbD
LRYKKNLISNYHFENNQEELINLTPLIDVVFVVLISFMIIAPMMEVEKISLAQAGEFSEKVTKSNSSFKIYVKSDNTIWMNNQQISESELKQVVENLFDLKKKPIVFHDEKASFGLYHRIKNILEKVGFQEMEIVLSNYEKK